MYVVPLLYPFMERIMFTCRKRNKQKASQQFIWKIWEKRRQKRYKFKWNSRTILSIINLRPTNVLKLNPTSWKDIILI